MNRRTFLRLLASLTAAGMVRLRDYSQQTAAARGNTMAALKGIHITTGGELDGTITTAVRNRINTWLTNHGYPTIPSGWSYRRVVREIYERVNPNFKLENFDIAD